MDIAQIDANASAWSNATGEGAAIGILDSGVRLSTSIAPNLDLARSVCSIQPGHADRRPG